MNLTASPLFFFFFNDTATTEIYTLSLHDALPICSANRAKDGAVKHPENEARSSSQVLTVPPVCPVLPPGAPANGRSEEHTSELQSRSDLVCRLLLEKKKKIEHTSYLHASGYAYHA